MPTPQEAPLAPGSVVGGRYRVVAPLGQGGMGVVYAVVDDSTGRRCALKVLLPSLAKSDKARERFAREAKALARVAHEHICEVVDAGVAEGRPFILMELLEGASLADTLAAEGALSWRETARHVAETALALDAAHAAGVIHRDLKLQNLFVARTSAGGAHIKLFDFGIAKLLGEDRKQTTGLLGTPAYMAPEQIHREQPVGPATDGYALGHIAYTLLVGEPYFQPEIEAKRGLYALFVAIMNGAIEPPVARAEARRGRHLPAGFDAWFSRATAVDPSLRFPSAAALAAALTSLAPDGG